METVELRIPRSHETALRELARLGANESTSLVAALRDAPVGLDIRILASRVASAVHIDETAALSLVRTLASIYNARLLDEEISPDVYARAVRLAAEKNDRLRTPENDWQRFETTLRELLASEGALLVAAKAAGLMFEAQHAYCDARVITDVRPVFRVDVREKPAAWMIVHTLRLEYHEGSEVKEFLVALTPNNLKKLRTLLARGGHKEDNLRSTLTEAGFSVLAVETHSES